MSQVCTSLLSYQAQLSIRVKWQSFNFKLHIIPNKTIGFHNMPKHCSLVKSFKADMPCREIHGAYDLSTSNSFQRSKASFGHSDEPFDGDKDFETQLQELFDEVKTMVKMGNKSGAVDLLQANFEAVKEQMSAGTKGMEEAAILDIIALGYMAIGDFEFVESLLNMLSELVDCQEDDELLLDSVLIHMASMYSTLGNLEKSMLLYQRVTNIIERKYGENSTFLVTPCMGMAKVLVSIGRAIKAEEMYHRAIAILESNRGVESEDLVVPLYGLGNLLIKEGKTMDAESPFTRILDIYMKLYGENDGRVGMAMCSLAHAKCAKGKADEAIVLYKRAIQVIKDSNYMALDDSTMEKMRIDLAELLHAVGRVKEGRKLLEECLLTMEQYKGKEHPNLVTHLLNLATSHSQSRNFVEAERLLRTSLDIMTKNVGPDDQSISFPMLSLAVNLFHLNRNEEAEQLALEVLRIREQAFGKDSLPVGEALDCLASIKTRLGRDDNELLDLLKRVLRIQEREFGRDGEEVMETIKKVVFYLDKLGRRDEKLPLQRRLSMLRVKHKQKVHY